MMQAVTQRRPMLKSTNELFAYPLQNIIVVKPFPNQEMDADSQEAVGMLFDEQFNVRIKTIFVVCGRNDC